MSSDKSAPKRASKGIPDRDGPRDECGVFGVYAPGSEVAKLAYFALYALQHRGQEAAGIVSYDGLHYHEHRAMGHVAGNFDRDDIIAKLPPNLKTLAQKQREQIGGGGKFEAPSFIITKANMAQYADKLTEVMFLSYKMLEFLYAYERNNTPQLFGIIRQKPASTPR